MCRAVHQVHVKFAVASAPGVHAWGLPPASRGSNDARLAVQIEMPAISTSSQSKPTLLTIGPSAHTASALPPNEIAVRMPATRERILS